MTKREFKFFTVIILLVGMFVGYFIGYVTTFVAVYPIDANDSESHESVESTEADLITKSSETKSSTLTIYDAPDHHKYLSICWCSECNQPNSYGVKYCEKCGAEHTDDWYTYQYVQCPTCGEYVFNSMRDTSINHCSECGTEVGQPTKVLQKAILRLEG